MIYVFFQPWLPLFKSLVKLCLVQLGRQQEAFSYLAIKSFSLTKVSFSEDLPSAMALSIPIAKFQFGLFTKLK